MTVYYRSVAVAALFLRAAVCWPRKKGWISPLSSIGLHILTPRATAFLRSYGIANVGSLMLNMSTARSR